MPDQPITTAQSDKISARARKWQAKYGRACPARTTPEARLKDAAENVVIARMMGWDMDGVFAVLQEVLEEMSSDPGEGE